MKGTIVAAALAGLLLTACSSGSGSAQSYESSRQVADAVGCTGIEIDEEPIGFASVTPTDTADCSWQGLDLTISHFDDGGQTDAVLTVAEGIACDLTSGQGSIYVRGDDWVVDADFSPAQADDVASTSGGEVGTIDC